MYYFLLSVVLQLKLMWGDSRSHQGVDLSESNEVFLYFPVLTADGSSVLGIHRF